MLVESLVPLTAALVVTALVALVASVLLWRRSAAITRTLDGLATSLGRRADDVPGQISTARVELAERTAAIEHLLWSITRADANLEQTRAALASRRRALDEVRISLERGRDSVERGKAALRLVMRAIELRRTILG